jgi:hypothetical protein
MRIYDSKYLSVTSIIGLKEPFDDKSFKIWCEKNGKDHELIATTSRLLGERVSEALENKFLGLEYFTPPAVDECDRGLYRAVDDFLKEWVILDAERVVYCDKYHYAGRLDLIAQNKETEEKVLFDAKTFGAWKRKPYKRDSKKVKHAKWQTTLYANAIDWEDKLAVVVFNGDGSFSIEYLKPDKEIMEFFFGHFTGLNHLIFQCIDLQATYHISQLVQRSIASFK